MDESEQIILETEWSHLVDVDKLESGVTKLSISPDAEARARLAQRLGILSLDGLKSEVTITRRAGDAAFHIAGSIEAQVTQNCVVTLEPLQGKISDEFEGWFADPDAAVSIAKARQEKLTKKGHGEQPILEERDDPEAIINGKIDLGELVTQYLSLAINPYPHAEGVSFESTPHAAKQSDDLAKNPFAALAEWKEKLTGGDN